MKKNLITVVILALVLSNLILTAILTITILPETKKANELITQVCSAINLELNSGENAASDITSIPFDDIDTYDIPEQMQINLKESGDGSKHIAVITVSVSMNKKSKGYSTYGKEIADKESLIKNEINAVVSNYTYEEFTADQQEVQNAIVTSLHKLFDSDFIIAVGFPTVTCQ